MLSEGIRVKTRDEKEGVVVESSFDMLGWWDVLLDKDKKSLQYAPDELTVIDVPKPESETPAQANVAIFSNQLVRLHDGRMGFTQKNRVGDVWDVYVCESQKVERHADWRLTPLPIPEPAPVSPPKPCTALVPVGEVRTLKEAVYKPPEAVYTTAYLMLSVVYASKWMETWLVLGGVVKEIRRLRGAKTGQKITLPNKQDIVIVPTPSKSGLNTHEVYRKALKSGRFTTDQLDQLGKASTLFALVESQVKDVPL